jgi:putative copper export protein
VQQNAAVAIPASLILAFLGINASQVSTTRSIFGHQYLGMYLTVAAVIVLGVVLSVALYIQQRRDARHHRTSDHRSRWDAGS